MRRCEKRAYNGRERGVSRNSVEIHDDSAVTEERFRLSGSMSCESVRSVSWEIGPSRGAEARTSSPKVGSAETPLWRAILGTPETSTASFVFPERGLLGRGETPSTRRQCPPLNDRIDDPASIPVVSIPHFPRLHRESGSGMRRGIRQWPDEARSEIKAHKSEKLVARFIMKTASE